MREQRVGLAVYVKNLKPARNLRKFGNVHYVSRRLNYVTMYAPAENIEQTIERIAKLDFVTKVERGHRHEIPTVYNNSKPDKAKELDYQFEQNQVLSLVRGDHPLEIDKQ